MRIDSDYVVIGAGAASLAFCDTLLSETKSTITIIDRRETVGGHWNDAYSFVTLDQPGSNYGVNSLELVTNDKLDCAGLNAGLGRLSDLSSIKSYFRRVQRKLEDSGRFTFIAGASYDWNRGVALGQAEEIKIDERSTLVNATLANTNIPVLCAPNFSWDSSVSLVPPNSLPDLPHPYQSIIVVGGGKTAVDAIIWLLEQAKYDAAQITWIVSRDAWFINRANLQGHISLANRSLQAIVDQCKFSLQVNSIDEFCSNMEKEGHLFRVSQRVMPTAYHGACVSERELDLLTTVNDVVRLGRVRCIKPEAITLERGKIGILKNALVVNCSSSGVSYSSIGNSRVFEQGVVNLLPLRCFQSLFSAALIAKIESLPVETVEKNQLSQPIGKIDSMSDWAANQPKQIQNEIAWASNENLVDWLSGSRLNPIGRLIANAPASREIQCSITKILELSYPSAMRLADLAR